MKKKQQNKFHIFGGGIAGTKNEFFETKCRKITKKRKHLYSKKYKIPTLRSKKRKTKTRKVLPYPSFSYPRRSKRINIFGGGIVGGKKDFFETKCRKMKRHVKKIKGGNTKKEKLEMVIHSIPHHIKVKLNLINEDNEQEFISKNLDKNFKQIIEIIFENKDEKKDSEVCMNEVNEFLDAYIKFSDLDKKDYTDTLQLFGICEKHFDAPEEDLTDLTFLVEASPEQKMNFSKQSAEKLQSLSTLSSNENNKPQIGTHKEPQSTPVINVYIDLDNTYLLDHLYYDTKDDDFNIQNIMTLFGDEDRLNKLNEFIKLLLSLNINIFILTSNRIDIKNFFKETLKLIQTQPDYHYLKKCISQHNNFISVFLNVEGRIINDISQENKIKLLNENAPQATSDPPKINILIDDFRGGHINSAIRITSSQTIKEYDASNIYYPEINDNISTFKTKYNGIIRKKPNELFEIKLIEGRDNKVIATINPFFLGMMHNQKYIEDNNIFYYLVETTKNKVKTGLFIDDIHFLMEQIPNIIKFHSRASLSQHKPPTTELVNEPLIDSVNTMNVLVYCHPYKLTGTIEPFEFKYTDKNGTEQKHAMCDYALNNNTPWHNVADELKTDFPNNTQNTIIIETVDQDLHGNADYKVDGFTDLFINSKLNKYNAVFIPDCGSNSWERNTVLFNKTDSILSSPQNTDLIYKICSIYKSTKLLKENGVCIVSALPNNEKIIRLIGELFEDKLFQVTIFYGTPINTSCIYIKKVKETIEFQETENTDYCKITEQFIHEKWVQILSR